MKIEFILLYMVLNALRTVVSQFYIQYKMSGLVGFLVPTIVITNGNEILSRGQTPDGV